MMYTDTTRGRNAAKDPAVIRFQGKYFMYYSLLPGVGNEDKSWGIGIAVSGDLENWNRAGELGLQGEVEKNGICAPAALLYDGMVHLFYQTYGNNEKDAICHAWSQDGIHFTRDETNPVVRAEGFWNNGRAIDADVVVFQNRLYLYYATRNPKGNIQMLGVSRCPLDGQFHREGWKQCCEASILRPELPWEQDCIEAAAAMARFGKVYLFYAGAYNNSPQQIGVAVSTDGVHFERLCDKPFLPNGEPGSWNCSESGHPYVFEDEDGRVYLFYQGNNDNGASWYLSKAEVSFDEKEMPYIIKQ